MNTSVSLRTKRLRLLPITAEDRSLIYQGLSDPEVTKYYGIHLVSLQHAQEQMEWYSELESTKTGIWWKAELLSTGEFTGACGLNDMRSERAEIGCWLLPGFQGRGFATEIMTSVLDYGFHTLNLSKIYGLTDPENSSVANLLQKLGFEFQEEVTELSLKSGSPEIQHYWSLTP